MVKKGKITFLFSKNIMVLGAFEQICPHKDNMNYCWNCNFVALLSRKK